MKKLLFSLVVFSFLFSCKNSEDKGEMPDAGQIAGEIASLEKAYGADPVKARAKVPQLLEKYETYVSLAGGDKNKKVDYLLRAGEMAALLNQYDKALGYYDKILKEFPQSPKAPIALFMKGYTLDDKLNQLDRAKAAYEEFLKKYPDNDFADDTRFLLENLGKSEEEIIKQFEAKAREQ